MDMHGWLSEEGDFGGIGTQAYVQACGHTAVYWGWLDPGYSLPRLVQPSRDAYKAQRAVRVLEDSGNGQTLGLALQELA